MEGTTTGRTEKLRKACNECNVAKVRCSGQRTGCDRCGGFKLRCIYEQSRVGRVPGIRAKKKHPINDQTQLHSARPRPQSRAQPSPGESRPQPDDSIHVQNNQRTYGAPAIGNWVPQPMDQGPFSHEIDDFFDHPLDSGQAEPCGRTQSNVVMGQSMSTSETDLTDLSLDFEFDAVLEQSSATTESIHEKSDLMPMSRMRTSVVNLPVESGIEIESKSNSQCILACCAIITSLENFIDAQIKILDLALDVVKKAVSSLVQVIEQGPRSQRCRMLLSVIMNQAILILETGCSSFIEQDTNTEGSTGGLPQLENMGDMLPGMGFSTFRLDAGEQRAWRARVVLKEIRQVNEVWKRVRTLDARERAFSGPATREELCHDQLGFRLSTITERLEKIQNLS